MLKVLWCGDAVIQSGFSVVTHNVCNRLSTMYDVVVYGIGHNGSIVHPYTYRIQPASVGGDLYGFRGFTEFVDSVNPDVIVLFNDDFVVLQYLSLIINHSACKTVILPINCFPINPYNAMNISMCGVNNILTYTEYAKNKFREVNPNLDIDTMYHGVDVSIFQPVLDVKKNNGIDDYFVIGNINTNTVRKRLDLFLKIFSKFASDKEKVKCVIHTDRIRGEYLLDEIAKQYGILDKVIFSSGRLTFTAMNELYNLMDVVCTTCIGEGFGLSLLEGAACGKPIVCPDLGNLRDIWSMGADFVKVSHKDYIPYTAFEGEVVDIDDFVRALNKLYYDPIHRTNLGSDALRRVYDAKFNWNNVADKVSNAIQKAMKWKLVTVEATR